MKQFFDKHYTFIITSLILVSIFLTFYRYVVLKDYNAFNSEEFYSDTD